MTTWRNTPGRTNVDVAVIGAGMAGASVAAELSKSVSVVLLEVESSAGVHSTGRSAAAYLPSYGGPVVRRLTAASRALFDAHSSEFGLELLRSRPLLWLATDETSHAAVTDLLRADPLLQVLTPTEALSLCPALVSDRVICAALDNSAMDIDVAALHQGYLSAFKRRGGQVRYSVNVSEIRRSRDTWEIRLGDDTIGCRQVVDAAGAWVDEVAAVASVPRLGIRPTRRSVLVSPSRIHTDISDWPIVIDGSERWYFKPENSAILASPADETDVPPGDVRPDQLAIAQTLDVLGEVTSLGLRSVSHSWAGLRSFVSDRSPVVGAWPTHPGFHFVAAQGGYGIQMAPALARLAADVILTGSLSDETGKYEVGIDEVGPARLA
jgi:D-arginine dehydrogenase